MSSENRRIRPNALKSEVPPLNRSFGWPGEERVEDETEVPLNIARHGVETTYRNGEGVPPVPLRQIEKG